MKLFYFQNSVELNTFISQNSSSLERGKFLQSWEWGEVLEKEGKKVLRIGLQNGQGKIILALSLSLEKFLSLITYYYSPGGIVTNFSSFQEEKEVLDFLLKSLRELDSKVLFLRIETSQKSLDFFKKSKFRFKKTSSLQPAQTLILDLSLGEEKLLANLHQKTRYNLRLAYKKGVVITEGKNEDIKEFYRLLKVTARRDGFRLHPLEHYKNLLSPTSPKFIRLFLASYQGKNIAAGLFSFYDQKVTYLHGASDNSFRNLMAPYLLQWSVIKIALQEGYRYYDFYGIDEKKWPGVTRFKKGFRGKEFKYPGTYDLVFRPGFYLIYKLFRKLRRMF